MAAIQSFNALEFLNSLASQVTTQASVAGYLIDNVRATYAVGGAVEEDHRQLRAIEGDTSRAVDGGESGGA